MTDNIFEIKKIVVKLVSSLSPRNKEVILRRFGIKGDKETLEAIGSSYGITRERVRQIEEASLKSIRENEEFAKLAGPYVRLARNIIEETGGVIRENELFAAFSENQKQSPVNASLVLVLTLDNTAQRHPEDDSYHAYWSSSAEKAQTFEDAINNFVQAFKERKSLVPQAAVTNFAVQAIGSDLDTDTMHSYLSISKKVGVNVFGEVGLTKWADVKPRGVRDKSYLVLKKAGEPKHFREIAQLINETNFSSKKAHVQTVHNELIKDKRFVLVGRGIYGLAEWGYKKGTVKDVIADLVRSKGPMRKDDIVAHVLSARMVKPNTVLLGIQDRKLFQEDTEGKISLKVQEI